MKKLTLMYHSVGSDQKRDVGEEIYNVSTSSFREQMECLTRRLPRKEIIITFDDGDITNYTNAFPVLKELGLKAYFFVIVHKIGTPGYMNWEQIRELKESGMIIGSHGLRHEILTEMNDKEIKHELRDSKRILEERLGGPIDNVSIPLGHYNSKVLDLAKDAGYKAVFTSSPHDKDSFKIGRLPVRADWSMDDFQKALHNGLSFKDKAWDILKSSAKKILGAGRYDRIRANILARKS